MQRVSEHNTLRQILGSWNGFDELVGKIADELGFSDDTHDHLIRTGLATYLICGMLDEAEEIKSDSTMREIFLSWLRIRPEMQKALTRAGNTARAAR